MPKVKYTTELIDRMKVLVGEGHTASHVAGVVSGESGLKLSRNAVIGAMRRHGGHFKYGSSSGPPEGRRPRELIQPRTATEADVTARKARRVRLRAVIRAVAQRPKPSTAPDVGCQCGFMSLGPHTCRWPMWPHWAKTAVQLYCGSSKGDRVPYCPWHMKEGYRQPNSTREPVSVFTATSVLPNPPKSNVA